MTEKRPRRPPDPNQFAKRIDIVIGEAAKDADSLAASPDPHKNLTLSNWIGWAGRWTGRARADKLSPNNAAK
jgi:hypothetical protein